MARNVYFSHGKNTEQNLLEDLIIESISIWGEDFFYIPRQLVAKDDILGEDRLSQFKDAYPIEMYLESVDGFEGQGAFINKFGLMMEQSATLTLARKRWEQVVGSHTDNILPNRPSEGDLLYFPLTKGLFEIKFVEHQDAFYQLRKLYVYKLQVELFQYSSEKIDTGIADIDVFESLKTFSTTNNPTGFVSSVVLTNNGSGYLTAPAVVFTSATGTGAQATALLGTGVNAGKVIGVNITSGGSGYQSAPTVSFVSASGINAAATALTSIVIDAPDSFGDNNSFKNSASGVVFNGNNPFGDVVFPSN